MSIQSEPTSKPFGYQPALDGSRAVAVLLVMVAHALPFSPNTELLRTFRGANAGVMVFFVLSGFLITSLLIQEWRASGSISLGKFYARRALRLLPALILVLLVFGAIFAAFGFKGRVPLNAIIATIFYVANWVRAYNLFPLGGLSHCWSLSIEEQFYLCWPLILICMLRARWSSTRIVGFLVAAILCSVVERLVLLFYLTVRKPL